MNSNVKESAEFKRRLTLRAEKDKELDAIDKLKPKVFPWWLILISLALMFLVFFAAMLLFKAKGGLLIEGAVSLIAFFIPTFLWTNSKKFAEMDKLYNAKVNEIDEKYKALIKEKANEEKELHENT